jgi:hypothetical protein
MKLIIDDKDLHELPLPSIDTEGRIVVPPNLGRKKDVPNLPELTKKLITIDANSGTNQANLAKIHGISQSEVSILERGIDRTNIDGRKVNEELSAIGKTVRHSIADVATAKLMESLDLFEPTHIEQKELPGAAIKLATVIEKINGNGTQHGPSVTFNVYAPRMMREEQFETIILNER